MQAAHILRLTPARVRQLLQGGELEGERDEVGHWLIPARAVHERLERLRRESFLEAVGYDPSSIREMQQLVEVLHSQVEMLRAELDEAHAANRENRRIIAALTQRIPELEAPRSSPVRPQPAEPAEPSEPERAQPEEAEPEREEPNRVEPEREEPERVEPRPAREDAQEGSERPWWRRVFGG
jgi:hypothetical protein